MKYPINDKFRQALEQVRAAEPPMAESISDGAEAIARFVSPYMDLPADQVTEGDRRRLEKVDVLIQVALDQFS